MKKVIYVAITAVTLSSCASNQGCWQQASNNNWGETEGIHQNLTDSELEELIANCENCDEID